MIRRRSAVVTTLGSLLVAAAGCHHAPEVVPTPVVQASADNGAADRAEAARRDSIARADAARRDATARAARLRADSIARADADRRAREAANARTAMEARIYFDFDQSELKPDAVAALDAKIPVMQANRGIQIRIEGNADERGSDQYNLGLGQRRAGAAKRYLMDHGIEASRIETVSYGKERPVCTDHQESCWGQNRRDEFVITAGTIASN